MSAAVFSCPSTRIFLREGNAGRWESAARIYGMTIDAARRQHLALRMAEVEVAGGPVVSNDQNPPRPRLRSDRLLHDACRTAGIGVAEVRSASRLGSRKRQHVMWLLYQSGLGSEAIGQLVNRNHTTVLYGISCHKARLATIEAGALT